MIILTLLFAGLAVTLGVLLWRAARTEQQRTEARVAALADAIDGAPLHTTADDGRAGLFQSASAEAAPGAPVVLLAAVGAALLIIVLVALSAGSRTSAPAATSVAAVTASPLELLALRHAPDQNRLTVTGLVRNPAGTGPVSRVTAVVFFFDPQGTFITSARSPLDFATLNPGDEAPFRVSIPNDAAIGRYRVTFRTDAGIVRHVDKRRPQTLARQEAP